MSGRKSSTTSPLTMLPVKYEQVHFFCKNWHCSANFFHWEKDVTDTYWILLTVIPSHSFLQDDIDLMPFKHI